MTVRANAKAWAKKNRDKRKKIQKKSDLKHIARKQKTALIWWINHPEKRGIYKKVARRNARIRTATRRAMLRQNGGVLSKNIAQTLLTHQQGKCAYCFCDLTESGYHLDHIIPLAKMGPNEDSNIQLLCPLCNHRKGDRHPDEFHQYMIAIGEGRP